MQPLIGLVSGTYNRITLLQRMIETFRANIPVGISYTITLIDGGSTDGTLDWIREQPDIKLIEHGELRGAIKAFTEGAYATDAKYIIMANDDIEFPDGVVMRAFVHLEDTPTCGAVAFQDNRPIPGYHDNTHFKTLWMPALINGRAESIIYAQVGMFRKWLGDHVGWWLGVNKEMALSRTYGGDNFLSAKIWELGYTVDEVKDCIVVDFVAEDELRQINRAAGKVANQDDSMVYYRLWSKAIGGPTVPPMPTIQQQDTPSVRVLYLPIYEPGWAIQKQQKRGLRDALSRAKTPKGWNIAVQEIDYLAIPPERLKGVILDAVRTFEPRIILTQIQAPKPFTPALLQEIRDTLPRVAIINWNGDVAEGGLISHEMMNVLRHVDLQLTVNASVLDTYRQAGIAADYWQIGYEEPGDNLPDLAGRDVVWLANAYDEKRKELGKTLNFWRGVEGWTLGLFGSGWGALESGNTLYDFLKGKTIYSRSKIAIGSNEFPNAYGFISNRIFQAMAAGGCLYLQQHVPGLKELTKLLPGVHFIEWQDEDDLHGQLKYFLDPAHEDERRKIAEAGTRFVRAYHSFDARVVELFDLIKKHLKPYQAPEGNSVYLKYVGPMQEPFGIPSRTHERIKYQYEPGRPLLVDKLDAPYFLAERKLWELITE